MAGLAIKQNEYHRQSTLTYRCMSSPRTMEPWIEQSGSIGLCTSPDPQPDFTALLPTMLGGSCGPLRPSVLQSCTTLPPIWEVAWPAGDCSFASTPTEQIARFRDF